MLTDEGRVCDVCSEEIPTGTTYRVVHLPRDSAILFLEQQQGLDVIPTWTEVRDGTVRLDICQECNDSMSPNLDGSDEVA